MSEAITKACPRCGGWGEQADGYCVRCGGSGTVVDVEAMLQAELDEARAEVARLTARERGAARILSFVSTAHASAWSAEAEAWLAGCAP